MKAIRFFGVLILSLTVLSACGIKDSDAAAEAGSARPDAAQSSAESSSADAEGSEAGSEAAYSAIADFSAEEVEAFAEKVKECVTGEDWDGLAALVSDPVTVDGTACTAEEFGRLDFSSVSAAFIDAIRGESCREMFCNWQGVMLADGEIWFSETDGANGEKVLCVTAINGLLG